MSYFDTAYLVKCYVKEHGWEAVRVFPLSSATIEAVAETFRNLPGEVFLRTGDAVHLLSARAHGLTEIYSNDRHLLWAAPHLGLAGRDLIEPSATTAHS